MLRTRILITIVMTLIIVGCKEKPCIYTRPELIISERTAIDKNEVYWDYVLSNDLGWNCLDSTQIVDMLKSYLNTQIDNKKIYGISLLNKLEDYDPGESLSQPPSFFRNIMLDVYFDTATLNPQKFIFYDRSHKVVFKGGHWKN